MGAALRDQRGLLSFESAESLGLWMVKERLESQVHLARRAGERKDAFHGEQRRVTVEAWKCTCFWREQKVY